LKILVSLLVFILLCTPAVSDEVPEDLSSIELEANVYTKIAETMLIQRRVLVYTEQKFGVNSVESLESLEALAWMNSELTKYRDAEMYYQRAIKIIKEKMPQTSENTAKLAVNYFMLGDTYLYRKLYLHAEESYDDSISVAVDPGHRGDAFNRKAMIYKKTNNDEKTLGYYLEAVNAYRSARASKQVQERLLNTYRSIMKIYQKLDDLEKVQEYQNLIWTIEAQEREEENEEESY